MNAEITASQIATNCMCCGEIINLGYNYSELVPRMCDGCKDAIKWIKEFKRFCDSGEKKLVLCMDCKHGSIYCTEDVCGETLIECNRPDLGDVEIHGWKWFCADGERK